jgi:hypothetical protein
LSPSPSRPPREWIIESVLPRRVVSLLAGSPGVGKTSLIIPTLADIQSGKTVFGHLTTPTQVVFVSCDRSEEEHFSHMEALGFPLDLFPFFDQTTNRTSLDLVTGKVSSHFPNSLIFIDGFAMLSPDGDLKDYASVANFLVEAGNLCRRHNITILGSVHSPKSREGQGYADPRARVGGSVAWSAYSNLMIVVDKKSPDDPSDQFRSVSVMTRGSAGDFVLSYQKDPSSPGGALIPYDDPAVNQLLDLHLSEIPFERQFPTKEFVDFGKSMEIGPKEVEKWLARQLKDGMIARTSRGVYLRMKPN